MKKVLLWWLMAGLMGSLAPAQESATQQQLDKLSGQIQDLLEAQARQDERIGALEKQVAELSDKVNAPVVDTSASQEDLKKLAEQVQEIDRKRQEDRELILHQIEQLAKVTEETPGVEPVKPGHSAPSSGEPSVIPGHEYQVKEGDNLGLIINSCRAQGLKITLSQILAANPKMNPNLLLPGQKILIPDPAAK